VPGSLVVMDQALIGHPVDLGDRRTIFRRCSFRVTLTQGIDDFLDCRAHARFQRDVVLATALSLLGTFSCGFNIGHSRDPYGFDPVLIFAARGGERRVFSVFGPGLSIVGPMIGRRSGMVADAGLPGALWPHFCLTLH
jgi:hypothetical protein